MTLCLESASMSITAAKLMQLGDWRSPEGTHHTSSNYSLVLPILPEVLNGCWKMRRWWQTNNTRMGIQKRRKGISNVTAGLVWANWQYFANLDFCETLWNQESRGILSWWTVIIRHLDWFGRYPAPILSLYNSPEFKKYDKGGTGRRPLSNCCVDGFSPFCNMGLYGVIVVSSPLQLSGPFLQGHPPMQVATFFT